MAAAFILLTDLDYAEAPARSLKWIPSPATMLAPRTDALTQAFNRSPPVPEVSAERMVSRKPVNVREHAVEGRAGCKRRSQDDNTL